MLRGIEVVPLAQQIAHTEIVGGVANQLLTPPGPDDERAASSKVVTACWRRYPLGCIEDQVFVFRRILARHRAPGPNKERCDISSETPIGDSAAVTTPLIDEQPRVRNASRRFRKQLSRVASVALPTDHEGRSAYLPQPLRGIESIFRFNRSNHIGRVPVRSHSTQRSRKPHCCPGETLSERRARDSRR